MHTGMLYAFFSYFLWGLLPIYFKAVSNIPLLETVMHRAVWSMMFVILVLALRRQWSWLTGVLRKPRVLAGFAASSALLSASWLIYLYAVNTNRIVEASLGTFINPLVSVMLGFLLLKERMRVIQWAAIALATFGVVWLSWHNGHFPWLGLGIAVTFGIYGLLRKTAELGALEGLALETMLMFPLAFGYLAFLAFQGTNTFVNAPASTQWLLAAGGPLTAIPLLLFAEGARRLPLSVLGLMQYIAPMMQLIIGVWLFHEPFGGARLAGFAIIWAALALYSAEGLWRKWSTRPAA